MIPKILGAQRDFSSGEIDVALKRSDDHPARKTGLRQMKNMRILNSGGVQDRQGKTALFPLSGTGVTRTEAVTMSPGNDFKLCFGPGTLIIFNSAGAAVASFTAQGNGAALPWTAADLNRVVFAVLNLSIYITFLGTMKPQVVSWDGVSTWSIADYAELTIGNQKRTPFYRISPQGITLLVGAQTGSGIGVLASAAIFTAAHVGTRMRFVGRQILITAVTDAFSATATILESLPGHQNLGVNTDPRSSVSLGDIVIGGTSGSKGIVTALSVTGVDVQLITTNATTVYVGPPFGGENRTVAFQTGETVAGPAGSFVVGSAGPIDNPTIGVPLWDEEVINPMRGYPASVFVDQFRLGFTDFSVVPGGIAWSAINSPNDLYVGANPTDAIFEVAPDKVRVRYVVPGPEGSEFVFSDKKLYYIPISETNPLTPGSVAFKNISGDGCAQVQPRVTQEVILYVNAGGNSMMAIVAPGATNRPFNSRNLTEYHAHLFSNIRAIAAPTADDTFNERYIYVLNGDGSLVTGKYTPRGIDSDAIIGWGPWSGNGVINWVAALSADVLFTTTYFGQSTLCEVLDDSQYLDAAIPVNDLPVPFQGHPGPLWEFRNQSVFLMDQGTRPMGIYQVDANGNIIPQFTGGENLLSATLVAGQAWTSIVEPFCPDASPGQNVGQRMFKRRVSRFAAYVIQSSGFLMARLFAGPVTRTSPPLGTVMNTYRVPAYFQDDDATKPPPTRETAERWRPLGRAFDPRVAIIKDTPGPMQILEIGVQCSI